MQLKSGDISSSAAIGAELAQPSRPLEAQILGYSLLQHLVGHRWEDFPPEASSQLTSLAFSLLHQSAQGGVPWVVRSKAAALLATVIKRSGPEFLDSSLGQILGQAGAGPWMQDVVCLLLNYLTQEVVQMAPEGTAGDTRPLVVRLTAALPQVLGFVESTIEANYSALQQLPGGADRDARAPHVAAINAALGAAKAFADWAPVEELHRSRLVVASGVMLGSADYRGDGCEVLSLIAARKRTNEESEEGFAAAMQEVAAALMQAAEALLAPSALGELDYEGDNDEFGQAVCEAMATLGSFHLGTAFPDPSRRLAFLQIMLAFAQRPYLLLAEKALGLWAKLLQDAAHIKAPMAAPAGDAASPAAAAPPREMPLPPEAVLALMQLAAEQLQQRNPHVPQEDEEIPAYFDTFDDYKELMIGYRLKLSTIVKSAAAVLPQQALHAAAERLNAAVGAAGGVGGAGLEQARVLLESAVVFLESCMKAVWDAVASAGEADRAAVASATEPMLHSLLALQITDPSLLNSQARGLEAFARLAAMKPDLVPGVVSRVFELLVGSIAIEPGGHVAPPSKPAPGWKEGYQARASLSSECHSSQ